MQNNKKNNTKKNNTKKNNTKNNNTKKHNTNTNNNNYGEYFPFFGKMELYNNSKSAPKSVPKINVTLPNYYNNTLKNKKVNSKVNKKPYNQLSLKEMKEITESTKYFNYM